MTDQRTRLLDKRFHDILSGSVELGERIIASHQFLQGLCAQVDPLKCVDELVSSPLGLDAVQKAMFSDLRTEFLNGLASDVLEYLLRADGIGGDMVIFRIVEPPVFWRNFCRAFEDRALDQRAQRLFATVLSVLLQMPNRDTDPYRKLASNPVILDKLLASDHHEIREAGCLINHILSTTSTAYSSEAPGGRHDNDFADFRKISVIPTAGELVSQRSPALQPASMLGDLDGKETRVADYFDNTFHLLREDMMHELREELEIVLNKKQRRHRGLIVDVELDGIYTGPYDRKVPWGFLLECDMDFPIFQKLKHCERGMSFTDDSDQSAAELLKLRHEERKRLLTHDPSGSKLLRHRTLACLIADDAQIITLGTIHRDPSLLAMEPPNIVFQVEGRVDVSRTFLQLKAAKSLRLVQIDTPSFAFEPVLKALQKMRFLPLSDEILFWEKGKTVKGPLVSIPEITSELTQDPSIDIQMLFHTQTSVKLDTSQVQSLLAALNQKVSLIQGPPGTGKSFIGALLAKAMYKYTDQTILVVCYTNHALDQFLEDLINMGIERQHIVRFGSRPKPSVQDLSVTNVTRRFLSWEDRKDVEEWKSMANYYNDRLHNSFKKFISSDTDYSRMLRYIESRDPEFFTAFQVPAPEDGMSIVGPMGKPAGPAFLISRWAHGESPSFFKDEPNVQNAAHIWNMEPTHRQQKLESWKMGIMTDIVDDICVAGKRFNNCQDGLKSRFRGSLQLAGKRIIGCTTTGAAKYMEDITDISPDVLLVEEAGEILESHVITALSSSTTHMILIGDHKSLFERLVLKGFPHVTLSTQHHMRPEISSLIHALTYPDLIDAPETQNRDDIRGVQSNVIFVDHSHPEDDDKRIIDRGDGGSPSLKQNTFKVEMVLRIVCYLAYQGYESENIVILTPYLGQLSLLRDALKKERDPILNELDSNALWHAGLLGQVESMKKKDRIRLVTIDNYQGKESDIVVASLCRSNAFNAIGFMDSPERLNVLISRARNGLILVGNSSTFERSKKGGKLWSRFFDLLCKGRHFHRGFPVKCQRHPNSTRLMEQPDDFDISPTGGCTEPCGVLLSCGIHSCPLKCHTTSTALNRPDKHTTMLCELLIRDKCPAGVHTITWKCCEERPAKCKQCEIKKQTKLDLDAKEKRKAAVRERGFWIVGSRKLGTV